MRTQTSVLRALHSSGGGGDRRCVIIIVNKCIVKYVRISVVEGRKKWNSLGGMAVPPGNGGRLSC